MTRGLGLKLVKRETQAGTGIAESNLKVAKPWQWLIDGLMVKQMGESTNSFNSWSWDMLERTAPKAKAYNPAIARVHGNTEMWYVRVGCDVHAKTLNC